MTTSGISTLQYSTVVIRQRPVTNFSWTCECVVHFYASTFHNWAFEAGHAGPHLSGYQYLLDSGLA